MEDDKLVTMFVNIPFRLRKLTRAQAAMEHTNMGQITARALEAEFARLEAERQSAQTDR